MLLGGSDLVAHVFQGEPLKRHEDGPDWMPIDMQLAMHKNDRLRYDSIAVRHVRYAMLPREQVVDAGDLLSGMPVSDACGSTPFSLAASIKLYANGDAAAASQRADVENLFRPTI